MRLSLTSLRDGKPVTQQWKLAVAPNQDDVFVGRLWAQRKLDQLRSTQPVAQEPRRGIDTLAMSFGMGGGFQVQQPPSQNPPKPAEDPHKQQIIALSQEWSLLTPYTAFLVLENDREYPLWGINRQQRHRYWKPADALPQTPPPEAWVNRAASRIGPWSQESEEQQFARVVRTVRAALDGGNPAPADRLLDSIRDWPLAVRSSKYTELSQQAKAGLRREALLRAIDSYRALLAPAAPTEQLPAVANLLSRLAARPGVPLDFLRRHPYAEHLLKEVKLGGQTQTTSKPRADDRENPFAVAKPGSRSTPVEGSVQARAALQDEIAKQPARKGVAQHPLPLPVPDGNFTLTDLMDILACDFRN